MPKKKIITESDAIALIIREAKYRIGCKGFTPTFTLHRAEPDAPATTRARIGTPRRTTPNTGRPIARRRFVRPSPGIGESTTLIGGTTIRP
jgi:hypothetical protein